MRPDIFNVIIISSIVLVFSFMLWIQLDCINRTSYWNDRGFFIDVWDREIHQWVQCEYEPIPKEDNSD